jgi:hypothetical protein
MPNRTIINELLQKARSHYPGAVAVYPILVKDYSVKEPFKYIEIIEEMVSQELVWNNFADFITIQPKGINIIETGDYLKFMEKQL